MTFGEELHPLVVSTIDLPMLIHFEAWRKSCVRFNETTIGSYTRPVVSILSKIKIRSLKHDFFPKT